MGKFKYQRSKSKEGSSAKPQGMADELRDKDPTAGWDDSAEPSVVRDGDEKVYDLEERTAVFGENIVRFSKRIPRNPYNDRLIGQLVGCGTSVGDFRFSISRCKKESKETRYFLRMVAASEPSLAPDARIFYREANELLLIFAEIYRK